MFKRMAGIPLLLALACLASSCRRVDVSGMGTFPREWVQASTSIPANWGNLVSAGASPYEEDVMVLWFQDGAGNVRMVNYHAVKNQLVNVTLMRRQ